MLTKSWLLTVVTTVFLSGLSLLAQDKQDTPASETEDVKLAREQMQLSREQVALLRVQYVETGAEIERVEHPALRFTAPIREAHHGTVWIWGTHGRPAAVLELFQRTDSNFWDQAFHSTTDAPIKLTTSTGQTWTPKSSSLKFQPLPDAPLPADTPAGRIRQMKAFAQKFSGHEFWTSPPGRPRHELRLLTTHVHRYEDPDQQLIDGALFIIAQGTNPQVTLFLEAVNRVDEAKPIWQFGLGRTGMAEIVVLYDDKEVFRAPPLTNEIFPSTSSYWRTKAKFEDKGSQP